MRPDRESPAPTPGKGALEPADFGIGVLFATVGEAIIVGDARTEEIVLWNPAAERLFGYTPEEIIGKPIHTLVPEALLEQHRRGLAAYAATGRGPFIGTHKSIDLPALRKDGTPIEIALTLTPLDVPDHDGRFALAIIRDITHRKQLEDDLRRNHARLEEALERERRAAERLKELEATRRDLVSMMVHDLRTPLTVITAFVALLRRGWSEFDATQLEEFLERIEDNTDRLTSLVDDIMTIADIESGDFSYQLESLDLAQVVGRSVAEARAAAPGRTFEVRAPEGLPPVFGDLRRQLQVLTNLLSNASKFSPPDGSVVVTLEDSDGEVLVSVRDHGPGIPADEREKLFKKFSRLDSAKDVKGSGLGLFITKTMVEGQGGRIWVNDPPGGGAEFVYSIPVADDQVGAAP